MHVQQALALVSQQPELTEVLKIQLEVTEGQESAGAPPEINHVVQAAIKSVDRREGSIPTPIPSERGIPPVCPLPLVSAIRKVIQDCPGMCSLWQNWI